MKFRIGEKVHYRNYSGRIEKGIVKGMNGSFSYFVVYHCAGDWKNYRDYTGQSTWYEYLHKGWEPKTLRILKIRTWKNSKLVRK